MYPTIVTIYASYASATMCEIDVDYGKDIASKVIRVLPGSSYDRKKKRWLLPLFSLVELYGKPAWEISVDSEVEEAYLAQVRRMLANLRAMGARFSLKDGQPVLGIERLRGQAREDVPYLAKKHRDGIVKVLKREEDENVGHRGFAPGDRTASPRDNGQPERNGLAGQRVASTAGGAW